MNTSFFAHNRIRLNEAALGSIIILAAHSLMQRSNDASFTCEQEAHFWYLTGIDAPDWWLIVAGKNEWLVAPDIDAAHHIFDGSLSWDDARQISGIKHILTPKQADELLAELSKKNNTVHTLGNDPHASHYNFHENPAGQTMRRHLKKYFADIKDCRLEIAKLRAIKQPEEIEAIKRAIAITHRAFADVKKLLPTLHHEYEAEAEFTYRFRKSGARGHAYDPIVAGGKNACTLHYNENQSTLPQNGLLLIDIGARVDGYAADITRTYAIGTPTDRQIAVHAAVENAQQQIILLLRPGFSVAEYHEQVDNIMKNALISLNLMKSHDDTTNYRKYFPHAISHGLGIDVHDSLGAPTHFKPGMVLTVEPGIYIPEEGIGVRIEDDILITDTGHENLSGSLATSL